MQLGPPPASSSERPGCLPVPQGFRMRFLPSGRRTPRRLQSRRGKAADGLQGCAHRGLPPPLQLPGGRPVHQVPPGAADQPAARGQHLGRQPAQDQRQHFVGQPRPVRRGRPGEASDSPVRLFLRHLRLPRPGRRGAHRAPGPSSGAAAALPSRDTPSRHFRFFQFAPRRFLPLARPVALSLVDGLGRGAIGQRLANESRPPSWKPPAGEATQFFGSRRVPVPDRHRVLLVAAAGSPRSAAAALFGAASDRRLSPEGSVSPVAVSCRSPKEGRPPPSPGAARPDVTLGGHRLLGGAVDGRSEAPGVSMRRGARLLGFLCLWMPQLRCEGPVQPEQVHLSYPGDPTSMVVTWTTFGLAESLVVFGKAPGKDLPHRASGNATRFVDGGSLGRAMFIHRVTLHGLLPGQNYLYRCGSPWGWSRPYGFRALLNGSSWSPRFALFGDMGLENPQSLPRLQREVQQGWYDAVLHIGDFAYDLHSDNATVGDAFMRKIEAVAAFVPYMTCPGNHEEKYNFSNYRSRFSMPGDTENLWYSWDVGPAHLIAFSTEVYFYLDYGEQLVAKQFQWLERDLQEANRPARRGERPWIITMGHRPMYCSNNDKDDCTQYESIVRKGLKLDRYGLEDLFFKYGVDLMLWAHEHSYERLWPLYDYKVYNGSTTAPYTNPRVPVHIITGSAGCVERLDPFIPDPREWSALRVEDYGYARMQIVNRTHLWLEQVSDDQNGKVVDKIWLIKDRPGPGIDLHRKV